MISVIAVTNGSYNLFGTEDGEFILQGNLTKEQLRELQGEIDKAIKPKKR